MRKGPMKWRAAEENDSLTAFFIDPHRFASQSEAVGGNNPDEYGEIIEENFAISYPEKFLEEKFPGLYPWNREAISKGESG